MKRRLVNVLTLLSLVLCLAASALWVRGQFVSDYIAYDGPVGPGLGQAGITWNIFEWEVRG